MFNKFTKVDKAKAVKLYKDGLTISAIAKVIGCSSGSISQWFKDVPKSKKIGPPKGNIPWNKGIKWKLMEGNKHASIGKNGTQNAGRYQARQIIKEIKPCELCGAKMRSLLMVIHHKDEDVFNNKKNNLQRLCRKCHINLHRKKLEAGKLK
jgi:transposase-like protein